jgi:hypothetical protein
MESPGVKTRRMVIVVVTFACLAPAAAGFVLVSRTFGLSNALAVSLLLIPPLVIAVRLCLRWPDVRGRELAFLAILFSVASGGTLFVVWDSYATGMDRYHAEDVKWTEFERLIRRDPALRDVRVNMTGWKHVYWASGTVASEADLDRLKSLASRCGIGRRLDGPFAHSVSLTVRTQVGEGHR